MSSIINENKGKVTIRAIQSNVTTQPLNAVDPRTWLNNQDGFTYLLAHTFDGVIWGRYTSNGWQLSCDLKTPAFPELTQDSLLELRIFCAEEEIYVWRDDTQFRMRNIKDNVPNPTKKYEAYDEPQILWGTKGKMPKNQTTFVGLEDGTQGLVHYVPLPELGDFDAGNKRPVSLWLRHYVQKDGNTGLVNVVMSRLFDLTFEPVEETNGTQA